MASPSAQPHFEKFARRAEGWGGCGSTAKAPQRALEIPVVIHSAEGPRIFGGRSTRHRQACTAEAWAGILQRALEVPRRTFCRGPQCFCCASDFGAFTEDTYCATSPQPQPAKEGTTTVASAGAGQVGASLDTVESGHRRVVKCRRASESFSIVTRTTIDNANFVL